KMLELGVRSNDLPAVLTLVADHYHRANATWARLKGLIVYPVLVIIVSLGLTFMLSITFSRMQTNFLDQFPGPIPPAFSVTSVWMPQLILALVVLLALIAISVPALRSWLRCRLPAF